MASDPAHLLRERGVQVTAQRLAVFRAVTSDPHITADAVAEAVRKEIGAISLQSVYDCLAVLVAEGLVRRIQLPGSPARFEDRVGDNHHHLICRTCGRMVDVDCAVGDAPCLTASDDSGYEIDEAEVVYWGRCPGCARKTVRLKPDTTTTGRLKSAPTTAGRLKSAPTTAGRLKAAPTTAGRLKAAPTTKGPLKAAPTTKGPLKAAAPKGKRKRSSST